MNNIQNMAALNANSMDCGFLLFDVATKKTILDPSLVRKGNNSVKFVFGVKKHKTGEISALQLK
jgi:hypothetical protein